MLNRSSPRDITAPANARCWPILGARRHNTDASIDQKNTRKAAPKISAARQSKSKLAPRRPCSSSVMQPTIGETRIGLVNTILLATVGPLETLMAESHAEPRRVGISRAKPLRCDGGEDPCEARAPLSIVALQKSLTTTDLIQIAFAALGCAESSRS